MPLLEYQIEIRNNEHSTVVDWTDAPRQVTEYKATLDEATSIAFVPRVGCELPPVVIALDEYKRWIIFHKDYFGQRYYAIGWQTTVRGLNIKAIAWVYPSGKVELALEPSSPINTEDRKT